MNESARKMSELARQIFDGKIEYDEAIEQIKQIEAEYGKDVFPPVPFSKKDKPWDADYLRDLESQNMAGACSKEFFYHIAEVRRELDSGKKAFHLPYLIAAVVVIAILLIIVLSSSVNATYNNDAQGASIQEDDVLRLTGPQS